MMTNQEIFDKALAGVRAQGCPSWSPGDGCRYSGKDGIACNVGHAVPKWVAKQLDELGGASIRTVLDSHLSIVEPYFGSDPDESFLSELQGAHDAAAWWGREDFMNQYEWRMKQLARGFGLKYDPPV